MVLPPLQGRFPRVPLIRSLGMSLYPLLALTVVKTEPGSEPYGELKRVESLRLEHLRLPAACREHGRQ